MNLAPPSADQNFSFRHFFDVLLRRRWIVLSSWAAATLFSMGYILSIRPQFQADALLLIEKERGSIASPYANGMLVDNANSDYYQTQYELLRSVSIVSRVYNALGLKDHEEFGLSQGGVHRLRMAITTMPVFRSRLVHVYARSQDPELASRIANVLAETFVAENVSNQLFISKEVLQALQTMSTDPKTRLLYDSLPPVVGNDLIQSLKATLSKLQAEAAEMGQRLTPRHPSMIALKSNMDSVREQIRLETDRVVQSFKTELSGHLQGNNVRIVDRAEVPSAPVYPKKKRVMMMGLLAGLMLGCALAFLVEFLDQSVRTQQDVETKLEAPFLGMTPLVKVSAQRIQADLLAPENSLTAEAFRNLRTMVDFASVNSKGKSFLVTSSIQDEGKTYVSTNLATTFAQIGQSVLLISGDLRRPKLHRTLGVSAQNGISDFLAKGADVEELEELARDTNTPNLKLLPCGPPPPNPSELLNTPRLGALVAWAESRFDRVIVDSTPVFPISDTLLWARHIRSAVFVVRYGRTRVPVIRNALQRLQGAGVKILGAAVNAANLRGLTYNYSDYSYHQYYHDYRDAEPIQTS